MEKVLTAGKMIQYGALAFLALGMEVALLVVEGFIYQTTDFSSFAVWQNILHWVITCIIWGTSAILLLRGSKKEGFDPRQYKENPSIKGWIGAACLFLICLIFSYISWDNQFKVVAELTKKIEHTNFSSGIILFIFQYIYYLFESMLFVLIITFGQKASEIKKWNQRIPWGGIFCGLTWGMVHILTKGLQTGIEGVICSILYGLAYLCLKKNFKWSYIVLACMFMF